MTSYDPDTYLTLRMALLMSDPDAVRVYANNAEFNATINLISRWWPTILESLVETAEKNDAEMKEQIRLLSMGLGYVAPV